MYICMYIYIYIYIYNMGALSLTSFTINVLHTQTWVGLRLLTQETLLALIQMTLQKVHLRSQQPNNTYTYTYIHIYTYIYIYIYIGVCVYTYIYIYIYREREREREKPTTKQP